MSKPAYENVNGSDEWNQDLLNAAVGWIDSNPDLKPSFSTACGMVFTDNSAADDFDIEMGGFAYSNNIILDGKYVPFLYFAAEEIAVARRQSEPPAL